MIFIEQTLFRQAHLLGRRPCNPALTRNGANAVSTSPIKLHQGKVINTDHFRYSTVTLFAKFLGLSTSVPRAQAV